MVFEPKADNEDNFIMFFILLFFILINPSLIILFMHGAGSNYFSYALYITIGVMIIALISSKRVLIFRAVKMNEKASLSPQVLKPFFIIFGILFALGFISGLILWFDNSCSGGWVCLTGRDFFLFPIIGGCATSVVAFIVAKLSAFITDKYISSNAERRKSIKIVLAGIGIFFLILYYLIGYSCLFGSHQYCEYHIMKNFENSNQCYSMKVPDVEKSICLRELALKTRNIDLCAQAKELYDYVGDNCYTYFNQNKTAWSWLK